MSLKPSCQEVSNSPVEAISGLCVGAIRIVRQAYRQVSHLMNGILKLARPHETLTMFLLFLHLDLSMRKAGTLVESQPFFLFLEAEVGSVSKDRYLVDGAIAAPTVLLDNPSFCFGFIVRVTNSGTRTTTIY